MIDETKVEELLTKLRAIDAEKRAAKEDAREHKERIDDLLDEVEALRKALEGGADLPLFDEDEDDDEDDEEEPERMTALAAPAPATSASDEEPKDSKREVACPDCGGEGAVEDGDDIVDCERCGGSGQVEVPKKDDQLRLDAYELGAKARRAGRPESACPYQPESHHGRAWIDGWRQVQELPEEEDTDGPVL